MKRNLLLTGLLIMNVVLMLAQPPQGGKPRMTVEERAKKTTEWMVKELSLSQDQVAPVDSINLLFTKTQQILFQSSEGSRDKMRDAMTALEKEKETALSKVLTKEQLETYKEKAKEMMNNRGGGRGGR